MAHPKQKRAKVSKSAGISLPADLKDACAKKAASQDTSLSKVARTLLRQWLNDSSESFKQAGKAQADHAESSMKKRR